MAFTIILVDSVKKRIVFIVVGLLQSVLAEIKKHECRRLFYAKIVIFHRTFHFWKKIFRANYSAGPIGGMGFTMKSGEGKEVKRL